MSSAVQVFIKQIARFVASIQKEVLERSTSDKDLSGGQCWRINWASWKFQEKFKALRKSSLFWKMKIIVVWWRGFAMILFLGFQALIVVVFRFPELIDLEERTLAIMECSSSGSSFWFWDFYVHTNFWFIPIWHFAISPPYFNSEQVGLLDHIIPPRSHFLNTSVSLSLTHIHTLHSLF